MRGGLRNPPGGRPKGKSGSRYNWVVSASVTQDTKFAIEDLCNATGKPKSEVVRECLLHGLKELHNLEPK